MIFWERSPRKILLLEQGTLRETQQNSIYTLLRRSDNGLSYLYITLLQLCKRGREPNPALLSPAWSRRHGANSILAMQSLPLIRLPNTVDTIMA